jgi:Nif-specific regulatory protein
MKANYLSALHDIAHIVSQNRPHEDILREILTILAERVGLERGLISIFHAQLGEIHGDIWHGMDADNPQVKYKLGEGITGKVAEHGSPMAFTKLEEVPFFLDRSGLRQNLDLSELAFICVPIKYYNQVIGTLSVDQSNIDLAGEEHELDDELMLLNITASLIASYLEQVKTEKENNILRNALKTDSSVRRIMGNSRPIRNVVDLVTQVADTPTSVLITGETGTGKGLVAEAIHSLSSRSSGPFVKINCGAIPENLLESELFGHEKGAFTGATERKIGKLESAHNGTIFLDEIGELPLLSQVKILRVLQEKEIERIGSNKSLPIDVRIIAATNRELEIEVEQKNFRSDLYYRLNVFPIHMPSLRERGADITLLADYFVDKYARMLDKKVSRISTAAIDALMAYHWPGNVRELENTIERAILVAKNNVIQYHDLPPSLQMKEDVDNENEKIDHFKTKVEAFEKELIIDALKSSDGSQAKAAQILGTTTRIIQYKIKKLGIDFKRFRKRRSSLSE